MTVEDLLALLNNLPVEALSKEIYVGAHFDKVGIHPVSEQGSVIGYVLVELASDGPEQLELDLEK
jgi:hypothetical protein